MSGQFILARKTICLTQQVFWVTEILVAIERKHGTRNELQMIKRHSSLKFQLEFVFSSSPPPTVSFSLTILSESSSLSSRRIILAILGYTESFQSVDPFVEIFSFVHSFLIKADELSDYVNNVFLYIDPRRIPVPIGYVIFLSRKCKSKIVSNMSSTSAPCESISNCNSFLISSQLSGFPFPFHALSNFSLIFKNEMRFLCWR